MPKKICFCKIVAGDKSDCIVSPFKKMWHKKPLKNIIITERCLKKNSKKKTLMKNLD